MMVHDNGFHSIVSGLTWDMEEIKPGRQDLGLEGHEGGLADGQCHAGRQQCPAGGALQRHKELY